MSRRPITREQFDSVQKFPPSAAGEFVAEKTGLSVSTVRNIRKAKTWDKFQERRVAIKRKESADRAMKPAPRPTPPSVTVTKSLKTPRPTIVATGKPELVFTPSASITKGVAKPQGVRRIGLAQVTENDQLRMQIGGITARLDKYIKTSNKALQSLHEQDVVNRERIRILEKAEQDRQKTELRADSARRKPQGVFESFFNRGKKS